MKHLLPLLAIFVVGAAAGTLDVSIHTGVFRGTTNNATGIDSWLGLRYATPPVGDLRFRAPVALPAASNASIVVADTFGNACQQAPDSTLNAPISEDCLFLNVYRPAGTKANANLPVLFWIHGGSFHFGAASGYDPTALVNHSASIGKPIIFVSTNYRLNTYGFLASSLVPDADLNAGLLDTRMALQFVHDNIPAFGGDPSKVTIWGQSAGAGAVQSHVLFPPTDGRRLFRAAIADSSTGPFKSAPAAAQFDAPGKPFAEILSLTGCASGAQVLACLRKVDASVLTNYTTALVNAVPNGQLWEPAVGGAQSFMPERPSSRINSGRYRSVPYLGGTNINEGTVWAQSLLPNVIPPTTDLAVENANFEAYIRGLDFDPTRVSNATVQWALSTYPKDSASNGAPYSSGYSLFDRGAAFCTDEMYLAPRRRFFDKSSASATFYAYYFAELVPGAQAALGVFHGAELYFLGMLGGGVSAASEAGFVQQLLTMWVSFVSDLNPGSNWPQFTPSTRKVLQLQNGNITTILDDFHLNETTYLNSVQLLDEYEK